MMERNAVVTDDRSLRLRGGRNEANTHLSPAKIILLELMLRLNFGWIEELQVRNGEPVLVPKPKCVRRTKYGGTNGPRVDVTAIDLTRHPKVRDFFADPVWRGDGVILRLTIQEGLPDLSDIPDTDQA